MYIKNSQTLTHTCVSVQRKIRTLQRSDTTLGKPQSGCNETDVFGLHKKVDCLIRERGWEVLRDKMKQKKSLMIQLSHTYLEQGFSTFLMPRNVRNSKELLEPLRFAEPELKSTFKELLNWSKKTDWINVIHLIIFCVLFDSIIHFSSIYDRICFIINKTWKLSFSANREKS